LFYRKNKNQAQPNKRFRLDANAVVVDFDELAALPTNGNPPRVSRTTALLAFQLRKIPVQTTKQESGQG
jgi:hypothetical protein